MSVLACADGLVLWQWQDYSGQKATCIPSSAVQLVTAGTGTQAPTLQNSGTSSGEISSLADLGITSADVAEVFAWGFTAILAVWAIGFTVGSLRAALRKV